MLDTFQPALGRIHLRFRFALNVAAALAVASALLPIAVEDAGTVWPWDAAGRSVQALQLLAPALAAAAWAWLARARNSSLTAALGAVFTLGIATNLAAFHDEAFSAFFFGQPGSMRRAGLLLVLALALSGAAVLWRGGPRQGRRAELPARVLALLALVLLAAFVTLPRGLAADLGPLAGLSTTNVLLALVAPFAVILQCFRALRRTPVVAPHLGYTLAGAPAVVLLWGAKAASEAGRDALFGLALRSSLAFAAALVVLVFALDAALAQLLDAHVPEELARTGLWRDRLLLGSLNPAEFRPFLRDLARERRESLWLACAGQGDKSRLPDRIRLRLSGLTDEDVRRLDDDDLGHHLTLVATPPPGLAVLAKGRRIEAIACVLVATWGTAATLAARTQAPFPAWEIQPEPAWAHALFAEHLPAIALARASDDESAVDRAVARARLETPDPAISEAISHLGEAARHPARLPRAAARPGDELTEACRRAGLPYLVESDVLRYEDRRGRETDVFVLRTYAIRRVRRVDTPAGLVPSLWLERIDGTNAPEPADMRPGDREARVRIDLATDAWRHRLAPRLRLGANDGGADRLAEAILRGLGSTWNSSRFSEALHCTDRQRRLAVLGLPTVPASCDDLEAALEHDVAALLLPAMETHAAAHLFAPSDLPAALERALVLADERARRDAAAELSASLTELGAAPVPELALDAFGRAGGSPASPAWSAWFAAAPLLASAAGDYPARAREAHAKLFGRPPPTPTAADVP